MTQSRLNAVAICHVHQHILDNVDIKYLLRNLSAVLKHESQCLARDNGDCYV